MTGRAVSTHTLVVLAKSPRPGRVKTRLTPAFSPAEAAALASAAIRDTLDAVREARPGRTVLAWDAPVSRWLPPGGELLAQRGDGLDERLEHVFEDVLGDGVDRPTLVVGMDTPQITAVDLAVDWQGADAVLGPSEDGGYWAVGLRRPCPGAFLGVPMSTPQTCAEQLARLRRRGLEVRLLPTLRDVDEPEDAYAVAALAPSTRFGRLLHRMVQTPCSATRLYDAALSGAAVTIRQPLMPRGAPCTLAVADWLVMRPADELLLSRCEPPVLDIGCGPGRFVGALALKGVAALGVDVAAGAIEHTTRRGASALRRDVAMRLPAEGRWGTVLLMDGNIGIGGDPGSLLARCRALLRPGGVALVEVDRDDGVSVHTVITLHDEHGRHSASVPWARVGARRLVRLAGEVDLVAVEDWRVDGRVFVALRHPG